MPFDYKKEQKELYRPGTEPALVDVPPMHYVAVRGEGDPNEPGGSFAHAVEALYAVSYTLKMSYKGARRIEGFFDYVVPPLEGLWLSPGGAATPKSAFSWVAMIRLPEFIGRADVDWAVGEAARKKKLDLSAVAFFPFSEGRCVQCMHMGPYDTEPATLRKMELFARENGLHPATSAARPHHEIYLGDPRKTAPEKLKTILRLPVA